MNLELDCDTIVNNIKKASWFPYKTGNLKFNATSGQMINSNTYHIKFDSTIAPYVRFLEEGTKPHDIPRAFGRELPFGIGGKFNGKFHPGSTIHKGFISDKTIAEILEYFITIYGGVLK